MKPETFSQLIANDARLKIYNDTVPAGIVVFRVNDGTVVFSNRSFKDIFHLETCQEITQNWNSLFLSEKDREDLMVKFITEGEVRGREMPLQSPDGNTVWGLVSLSDIPVGDEDLLLFAFVDITAQKQAEAEIHQLANHDPLTQLPNLRLIKELMSQCLARANGVEEQISLLFIDLDNFKAVNDSLGHEAGDATLREVAVRLKDCVRESDTVARIGGDEFVVFMEGGDRQMVQDIGNRIVASIKSPIELDCGYANVGASVGAAFYPENGNSIYRLLKSADRAMYEVKNASKGSVAFA